MLERGSFFLLAATLVACGGSSATVTGSSGTGSSSGTGGSKGTGGSDTGTGGAPAPPMPDAKFIPKPTGKCPDFKPGMNTFSPAGINPRPVLLWFSSSAGKPPGPLVFYWHGAGGDPSEAPTVLGDKAMSGIQAAGGIIAAAYHDPVSNVLPWYLCLGGDQEDDLQVADEVLACAIEKFGVDLRRVHSVGFSAGAMNTEQFMARRSGYLASEVAYSGAQIGSPPIQDPKNPYAGMLLYGGSSDVVIVSFETETKAYHQWMTMNGHFSFVCDHDMGHTVPLDARDSAYQFLQDHPFGVSPEPYAKALPAGFPKYCSL